MRNGFTSEKHIQREIRSLEIFILIVRIQLSVSIYEFIFEFFFKKNCK